MDITPYLTPFKNPKPLLSPSAIPGTYNSHAVDCPFVFQHNGKFFMLHVGFDGKGYQTALAVSEDLLNWSHYANVLERQETRTWDSGNAAGIWLLREEDTLKEVPKLLKYKGKYWMLYHSYPGEGYEEGAAEMSFATCEDEDLKHWTRLPAPVFSWRDGAPWEHGGLYKGAVFQSNGKFYMLYNAKNNTEWPWFEQTGLACSDDMLTWNRPIDHPVIPIRPDNWDQLFVSDSYPVFDNGRWLAFYFGNGPRGAEDGLAWSNDLYNWERLDEPILKHGPVGSHDEYHAHKACVLRHNGILYHFYTGVRPARQDEAVAKLGYSEYRAIYVATSRELVLG